MSNTFTETNKKPPEEFGHFERMLTIQEAAKELGVHLGAASGDKVGRDSGLRAV